MLQTRTLAILKPDCMQRNLGGKVIDRLLEAGFSIMALKMVKLTRESAGAFYAVHKERAFYQDLLEFMTERPVIVMVLQKKDAVADLRTVIGATDPQEAENGTIRKVYAENKQRNIIHASDSPENAGKEITFFFSHIELIDATGVNHDE
jgi:nucleoside-diphosphate kinase